MQSPVNDILPSVAECIDRIIAQILSRGPNEATAIGPKLMCAPPEDFMLGKGRKMIRASRYPRSSEGYDLNDYVNNTIGKYIELETLQRATLHFIVPSRQLPMLGEVSLKSRNPHLNPERNLKRRRKSVSAGGGEKGKSRRVHVVGDHRRLKRKQSH